MYCWILQFLSWGCDWNEQKHTVLHRHNMLGCFLGLLSSLNFGIKPQSSLLHSVLPMILKWRCMVKGKILERHNYEIGYGILDCKVEQRQRLKCNALFHKGSSATARAGASRNAWRTARIALALVMSGEVVVCRLHKFNEDQWKWAKALLNLAAQTLQRVIAPEHREQAAIFWGRFLLTHWKAFILFPELDLNKVTTPPFLSFNRFWNGCIQSSAL